MNVSIKVVAKVLPSRRFSKIAEENSSYRSEQFSLTIFKNSKTNYDHKIKTKVLFGLHFLKQFILKTCSNGMQLLKKRFGRIKKNLSTENFVWNWRHLYVTTTVKTINVFFDPFSF